MLQVNEMAQSIAQSVAQSIAPVPLVRTKSQSALVSQLAELGLGEFTHVFCGPAPDGMDLQRMDGLLHLTEEQDEELRENLLEAKVPKRVRIDFFNWLKKKRTNLPLRPPANSKSGHFYGLRDCMNDSDATGLEASVVLKVDIEPFGSRN